MSGQVEAGSRTQIKLLQNDLLGARDQQILRVVAMVDSMPQRGEADGVIAPLRARLAVLRPSRKLNFTRLLFQPMDRLIVAPAKWKREALTVPRSALAPLGRAVRAALSARAVALDVELERLGPDDDAAVSRLGPELWTAGAEVLVDAPAPADWTEATGLQEADYQAIRAVAFPLLARAARLNELLHGGSADSKAQRRDIEELLVAAVPDGTAGFAGLVTLLAAGMPRADYVFMVADDVVGRQADPELRLAVDRAMDATIDAIDVQFTGLARLDNAVDALRRAAITIEDLETQCGQRVSRKARLGQLRQTIDGESRAFFGQALEGQLLHPAQTISEADDTQIFALEAAAREVRRFETTARRLGGAEHYDRTIKSALTSLKPQPGEEMQTVIDRMRLIEILRGPEAAMAMVAA